MNIPVINQPLIFARYCGISSKGLLRLRDLFLHFVLLYFSLYSLLLALFSLIPATVGLAATAVAPHLPRRSPHPTKPHDQLLDCQATVISVYIQAFYQVTPGDITERTIKIGFQGPSVCSTKEIGHLISHLHIPSASFCDGFRFRCSNPIHFTRRCQSQ